MIVYSLGQTNSQHPFPFLMGFLQGKSLWGHMMGIQRTMELVQEQLRQGS